VNKEVIPSDPCGNQKEAHGKLFSEAILGLLLDLLVVYNCRELTQIILTLTVSIAGDRIYWEEKTVARSLCVV